MNNPEEEQSIKSNVERILALDLLAEEQSNRENYGEASYCTDDANQIERELGVLYNIVLDFQHNELAYVWRNNSIYAVLNTVEWTWLTEQEIQELSA